VSNPSGMIAAPVYVIGSAPEARNSREFTDRSGSVAVGGIPQVLAPPNANRSKLWISNPNVSGSLWFAPFANALANGEGSVELPPGCAVSFNDDAPPGPISIVGAAADMKFTAWEG
jgi:hypothetical protein